MTNSRYPALRGSIVTFLATVYPERVEELSIAQIKYEYYEYQDIMKALQYLVDRGYIERTCERHPARVYQKIRFYRARAEGIDLVQGITVDPGVLVEEEV